MSSLAEFQMYFMYLEQEKDREIRTTLEKKLKTKAKTITRDGIMDAYKIKHRVNNYFARDMG